MDGFGGSLLFLPFLPFMLAFIFCLAPAGTIGLENVPSLLADILVPGVADVEERVRVEFRFTPLNKGLLLSST